jgi:spore germination cell wall hydrolase CwlJ-like protein
MRRIIMEIGFVSGILLTAHTIIMIPDMIRDLARRPVEVFAIETHSPAPAIVHRNYIHTSSHPVLLYRTTENLSLSPKEMDCLAKNIYFEAGAEDRAGKVAVAQITYNRLRDGRWGKTFCQVIYSPYQFSWTLDPRKNQTQPIGANWENSKQAARDFVAGKRVDRLGDSMHYHADWIRAPRWANPTDRVHKIGQHVFYAMK